MTVFKRGKVYWYDFWRNKVRYVGSTGVSVKRDAEDIESAIKTALARAEVGITPTRSRSFPNFDQAMKEFLEWSEIEHSEKPATARRHKVSSRALLEYFGKSRIDRIDTAAVEDFKDWRRVQKALPKKTKHVKPQPTGQIKPATVNRELACLKAMFFYLKKRKKIQIENPVSDVKMLKEERQFHVLTHEQEARYLANCDQTLADIAVLMIETGMRNDEVYKMRMEHIHLRDRYYANLKGKTPSARRRIPLSERAVQVIASRMEFVEGPHLFPGGKAGNSDKPIVKVNAAHYGALSRCKLPRFRLYDLRHTFATRFVEAGNDLRTLADILGHKDLRMVMIYSHPTDPHKRGQFRRLEAYNRERQREASGVPTIFPTSLEEDEELSVVND